MTVIDIRDELYQRQIEIVEVTDEYIYYAEEKNVDGIDALYLLEYDCAAEKERVMAYFTFDDASYIQHYYSCKDSIFLLFENDSSKVWIIKIDKSSGGEVLRKSVKLIGRFFDCVPIDDNNLVIYTKADDENRSLFNRCLEATNRDTMANLYDLDKGYRYFIKDFRTAELVRNEMHVFCDSKGREYMLLCEPYSDEASKEEYAREKERVGGDIRDNIWSISKNKFLKGVRSGREELELKKIASAGTDGLVRFECICGDSIVFRAKKFSTGQEKFLAMSTLSGKVVPISDVKKRSEKSRYFTDGNGGRIYYMFKDDSVVNLRGEINSRAHIKYPESIGRLECCFDDRFIVADRSKAEDEPMISIYDSVKGKTDTYEARCKTNGNLLVLF